MRRIELITTTNLTTGNKRYYMNSGGVGEDSRRITKMAYDRWYAMASRYECLYTRSTKTHRRSYLVAVI